MHLKSVETTPNPNSIKLNLEEDLGAAVTYTLESKESCPKAIAAILNIQGVTSVFVCHDFLTLNKDPRADWAPIVDNATTILGGEIAEEQSVDAQRQSAEKEGQSQVFVQTFRGIPIQIKVVDHEGDTRISLGDRFNEAALFIQAESGADYLKERYWADHGVRYGNRIDVANEVAEELQGIFDQNALERAKSQALAKAASGLSIDTIKEWLADSSWQRRLAAVQELSRIDEPLALLVSAVTDENVHVRRLAAAALGTTGSALAVEPLCQAMLNDQSVGVRRTAGDALSDIGDVAAQAAICRALGDANKLVRWRAARFLSDIGTAEALPYLENAANDPAFEVRLEIESAICRIQGGAETLGPAWKRIMEQS